MPHKRSHLEQTLAHQLHCLNINDYEEEYRFHATRRWRFDFAWPDCKLAVETEGGTFVSGRHSRGAGMRADMEKYNTAAEMGWVVLRYDAQLVKTGFASAQIERLLITLREWAPG